MPRANKKVAKPKAAAPLSLSAFIQLDLANGPMLNVLVPDAPSPRVAAPAPPPPPAPSPRVVAPAPPPPPAPSPRVVAPRAEVAPPSASPTPRATRKRPNDGASAAKTLARGLRGTITGRVARATSPMPNPPLTVRDHARFPAKDTVLLLAGAPGEWALRAPYLFTGVDQALVVPYGERDNQRAPLTIVPYHDLTIVLTWQ